MKSYYIYKKKVCHEKYLKYLNENIGREVPKAGQDYTEM